MKWVRITLVLVALWVIPYTGSHAFMLDEGRPSFSPDGETILFHSNKGGICVMLSNCGDKRPIPGYHDIDNGITCNPTYSPDGEKIAFSTALDIADNRGDIYIMDKDGYNLNRLTSFTLDYEPLYTRLDIPVVIPKKRPMFSPDGSKIIFVHTEIDNSYSWIYTVNVDGTGLKRVSDEGAFDIDPAISPDGKKIVYTSHRSSKTCGYAPLGNGFKCSDGDVYIMNTDGSDKERLTDGESNYRYPSFSPDGKTMAYTGKSNVAKNKADIYIMDLITRKVKPVLDEPVGICPPIFTPDVNKIAYQNWRKGFVIEEISTGDKTILDYVDNDYSFSPDGSKIAFSDGVNGESVIGIINTDGSGYIQSDIDYLPSELDK
ncbi:MAG: hypothetical protein GY771_09970 [bacterium]|nr:hypothetical protein [bacterium]